MIQPSPNPIVPFDYTEEFFASWLPLLESAKTRGATKVQARVPWGAHESLRGVRDFSKSSRLRLERFLSFAAQKRLSVDLHLGFFSHPETFPDWLSGYDTLGMVPSAAWDGRGDCFGLRQVPNLENSDVKEGFFDFLREVISILTLYRSPEGPVETAFVDLSLLETDLSISNYDAFQNALALRYGSIQKLNIAYGTVFRDFGAFNSSQALRALSEKRPWLAAFDFQWARARRAKNWKEELRAIDEIQAAGSLVQFQAPVGGESRPTTGHWGILFDGVLLNSSSTGCFPFAPLGYLGSAAVWTYRLLEYFAARAAAQAVPFSTVSLERPEISTRDVVLVSGKYLARSFVGSLMEAIERGGRIYAVDSLPQYDENMETVAWTTSGVKKHLDIGGRTFCKLELGKGSVFYPLKPAPPSNDSWSEIRETVAALGFES